VGRIRRVDRVLDQETSFRLGGEHRKLQTRGFQEILTLAQRFFTTPELKAKSDDELMRYYSPARVEKLVGIFITLIIFALLILPVIAMYKLTSIGHGNSTVNAVGLLVVFTLLFSAAMSLLTKAKRHELFAASAAYCAVLVVFISNFSNDGR
jgi:ABC-type transport system involved in cytochrome bd biosynthesis fused ATPase/permease subunit